MVLPKWARKPKHKEELVATEKGWEVEKTGELLVSYRGLKSKLAELFKEADELKQSVTIKDDDKKVETVTVEDDSDEKSEDDGGSEKQEKKEEPKTTTTTTTTKPKRKRGRPRKNATNK